MNQAKIIVSKRILVTTVGLCVCNICFFPVSTYAARPVRKNSIPQRIKIEIAEMKSKGNPVVMKSILALGKANEPSRLNVRNGSSSYNISVHFRDTKGLSSMIFLNLQQVVDKHGFQRNRERKQGDNKKISLNISSRVKIRETSLVSEVKQSDGSVVQVLVTLL